MRRALADSGTLRVSELRFVARTDTLIAAAAPVMGLLARALLAVSGHYLVAAHTAASGDATTDQALSDRRAGVVRQRLVRNGVAASRLVAMGFGSSKPIRAAPNEPPAPVDRIEITKIQ